MLLLDSHSQGYYQREPMGSRAKLWHDIQHCHASVRCMLHPSHPLARLRLAKGYASHVDQAMEASP